LRLQPVCSEVELPPAWVGQSCGLASDLKFRAVFNVGRRPMAPAIGRRMAQRLGQLEAAGMDVDLHGGSSVELPADPTGDEYQNE
jgi:hypothetical protein